MVNLLNSGKKFEAAIKNAVPDYCIYYRLPDPPQSFQQSSALRFAWKNPCDCFIFNSKTGKLFCIELKSTKSKSISFEDVGSTEKQNRMIHKHQIISLAEFGKYENTVSGFIFNFRDEVAGLEKSYFQHIDDFVYMTKNLNKSSFNEKDLSSYNSVLIPGIKKRINYKWDITPLLSQ